LDLFRLGPVLHEKISDLKTTLDFENGSLSKARTGSLRHYPHLPSFTHRAAFNLSLPLIQCLLAMLWLIMLFHWAASSTCTIYPLSIAPTSGMLPFTITSLSSCFAPGRCWRGDYSGWARSDGQWINSPLSHQVHSLAHVHPNLLTQPCLRPKYLWLSQVCFYFNKGSYTASPCVSNL